MQTPDQWEELYQTINALSEQMSKMYLGVYYHRRAIIYVTERTDDWRIPD